MDMDERFLTTVANDAPLMLAWESYKKTEAFKNSLKWMSREECREGSSWAVFESGFRVALEMAASLHESINSASDDERFHNAPGAGAMASVIEYRDQIRQLQRI